MLAIVEAEKDARGAVAGAGVLDNHNLNRNPNLNSFMFDHEKLRVYQEALAFASWSEGVLDRAKKVQFTVMINWIGHELQFYSTSQKAMGAALHRIVGVSLTPPRGSVLECAAGLDLFAIKKGIEQIRVAAMARRRSKKSYPCWSGLIRSNSTDRLHETPISYRVNGEKGLRLGFR